MMSSIAISAAVGFVAAAIGVPLLERAARRKNLLDIPNQRSSHTVPTPRVGGLGIVLSTLGAWGLACVWMTARVDGAFAGMVGVFAAGAVIGVADDFRGLPTAVRMVLYLLCAWGAAAFGASIRTIHVPFAGMVQIGAIAGTVFSVLFVTWYTNLFNFMDGINGIAGSTALVTMGATAVLFGRSGFVAEAAFAGAAAAACLGFLPHNFPRANVFMGDGGAVFLGMAAGALSLRAVSLGLISAHGVLLLMFPFVFDATFTLVRRMLKKERFWAAHRSHIYQRLCDLGLSHAEVTSIYFIAATGCALSGLYYHRFPVMLRIMTVFILLVSFFGAAFYVLRRHNQRERPR